MTNPPKFGYPAIWREPDWLFSRHYIYIDIGCSKKDNSSLLLGKPALNDL